MVLNVTSLLNALATDLVVQLVEGVSRSGAIDSPGSGVVSLASAEPMTAQSQKDCGWIELVERPTGNLHARAPLRDGDRRRWLVVRGA